MKKNPIFCQIKNPSCITNIFGYLCKTTLLHLPSPPLSVSLASIFVESVIICTLSILQLACSASQQKPKSHNQVSQLCCERDSRDNDEHSGFVWCRYQKHLRCRTILSIGWHHLTEFTSGEPLGMSRHLSSPSSGGIIWNQSVTRG